MDSGFCKYIKLNALLQLIFFYTTSIECLKKTLEDTGCFFFH